MNAKIEDIMVSQVMTGTPHQTIGHIREVMRKHGISCFPIAGPDGEPVGIVTSTDLLEDHPDGKPVSQLMTTKVYTVPRYAKPSLAARTMRNHHIHHVVVTHENEIVGIVSSFDLLKLVEDHRFTMKNAPSTSKRKRGKRKEAEAHG